jgi:hypothetical protein
LQHSDKYRSKHFGTGEQLNVEALPITVLFQHISRGKSCVTARAFTQKICLFIVYLIKLPFVPNTRRRHL